MAKVNLVIGRTSMKHDENVPVIILESSQTLTSSASSQAFTVTAGERKSEAAYVAEVTVNGNNVFIDVGASPTAVNNQGAMILSGQTRYYRLFAGDTIAVIDEAP